MGTELLSLVDTDRDAVTGFRTIPIGYEATGSLHRRARLSETMLKQCYVLIVTDHDRVVATNHTRLLLDSAARWSMVAVGESIMCSVVKRVSTVCFAALPVGVCSVGAARLEDSQAQATLAADPPIEVALPRERLEFVREQLSLNISQLAATFDVGRKTVYQWLAGDAVPRVTHQRRIKSLFDVAMRWSEMSSSPVGDLLQTPLIANTSLLDLLRLPHPDEAVLAEILTGLRQARLRADMELVPWGKTVEQIARERGITLPDEASRRKNIDAAVLGARAQSK